MGGWRKSLEMLVQHSSNNDMHVWIAESDKDVSVSLSESLVDFFEQSKKVATHKQDLFFMNVKNKTKIFFLFIHFNLLFVDFFSMLLKVGKLYFDQKDLY